MRRSLLTLAAVAALAAPAWAGGPLDEARDAFAKGDYAAAAEAARQVPGEDEGYAKAQYLAGEAELCLERWGPAEDAFRTAAELRPDSVPVLVGLGRALLRQGETEEAEKLVRKAVQLDPKDAPAHRTLGELLVEAGRKKEARKALETAAKLDPKDPFAARGLVRLLLDADELDGAEQAARRLQKAAPAHPMGHFLAALVLDRKGEDREAIEAYEAALAKDDRFLDAHKNLAILCTAKNPLYEDAVRTQKALKHYKRYFELGGPDEQLRQIYETLLQFVEYREE